ncbi:BPTI/Kunitz domain-containing protein 2-like isoform X2 [Cucumis melo var. makuwa]|uniref:BPTI/Kunitz domain-containing protein 2-like isoform X2 n=1 Tax=Cucumis melo var. makuwa TaxID=1194695 RepID=A0A5D3BV93_CUCMM|nr:BPTI/Kunitz domain-containing protein 2-like isoform X2 [Cucumis melo var. makuwa]
MNSKAVVFACLLLLVSAVVAIAAEGNQEQPQSAKGVNDKRGVEESKMRCYHGCCRYYGHDCVRCCGSLAEAQDAAAAANAAAEEENEVEVTPQGWGGHGGWGGGGRSGWGGGGRGGRGGGGRGGWGGGGRGGWGGGGGRK